MKLIKKGMPLLLALAVMALCLLAVIIVPQLLPDYKGTIEKMDQSQKSAMLYVDGSEELELYPWNLLQNSVAATPEEFDYWYPAIHEMFVQFSYDDGYIADFSYQDLQRTEDGRFYFIRDKKVQRTDGENYLFNMVFDNYKICYYALQKEEPPLVGSEQETIAFLEKSWSEFIETNSLDGEIEAGGFVETPAYKGIEDNPFTVLMNRFDKLTYYGEAGGLLGASSQASYTWEEMYGLLFNKDFNCIAYNNCIYLIFSSGESSLVLIYGPSEKEFVGFSLKSY